MFQKGMEKAKLAGERNIKLFPYRLNELKFSSFCGLSERI